jgi:hypothetical protein
MTEQEIVSAPDLGLRLESQTKDTSMGQITQWHITGTGYPQATAELMGCGRDNSQRASLRIGIIAENPITGSHLLLLHELAGVGGHAYINAERLKFLYDFIAERDRTCKLEDEG